MVWQLSVAVTLILGMESQSPESVLAATEVGHDSVGACASLTVTVKKQLAELPEVSEAETITGLVPMLKLDPLGGSETTPATERPQLSVAEATQEAKALQLSVAVVTDKLGGQVTTGEVLSDT